MGTSLTGLKIKDSYSGLLKTTDNGGLGATEKLITDGLGNSSNLYMGTTGAIGIGAAPSGYGASFVVNSSSTGIYINNNGGTATFKMADAGVAEYSFTLPDGTGDFAISKGSSERMRIDSSGNTSMNGILSVNRATQTNQSTIIQSEGGESYIKAVNGASSVYQALIFTSANNTTTTERMRITSGGFLKASNDGLYASSTGTFHEIRNDADGSVLMSLHQRGATNPYGIAMKFNNASPNNTTNYFILAADSTADRFKVYSNGNVVNTNNSYGAISDAKLKENIVDASPKLDDLMQVQVRNFNYIGDDKKQLGVVAQELETVFPAMIDESPDFEEREVELRDENGEIVYETEQVLVSEAIAEELDADGNVITPAQEAVYETVTTDRPVMTTERVDLGTTTKSVKYSVFVPILVKAMQEQQEIINKLEARIAALEAK